jgi:gliding motility-associated-like protein
MQIALSSNGCSDTTMHTVFIDTDYTFYVPNSFSPNGDVHNPVFKCVAYGIYDFTMVIYDRWGTKLFESNDPEEGWDGNYKGKSCKEDIYVYRIDFTNVLDEYPRTVTGQVHLIR